MKEYPKKYVIRKFCLLVIGVFSIVLSLCIHAEEDEPPPQNSSIMDPTENDVLHQRTEAEKLSQKNPFAITQFNRNYILPYTYMPDPNQSTYYINKPLDNEEAKFQISLKAPIYLRANKEFDGVYFAFTMTSWWQLYNDILSSPFRETNYKPEIFYRWQPDIQLGDFNIWTVDASFVHQSNGQANLHSRSWNRFILRSMTEYNNWFYALSAWYRFKEDKKERPFEAEGDDNPDITDYMGYFEFTAGTKLNKWRLDATLRNNLKTNNNRGYFELNIAHPISYRFDVLFQYLTGYGENLIDYNHKIERVGIGVQFRSF